MSHSSQLMSLVNLQKIQNTIGVKLVQVNLLKQF